MSEIYSCSNCQYKGKSVLINYCKNCITEKGNMTSKPSNWAPLETENVNHPNHYNRKGGMECIDEMILIFGREAVKNFCLCNAWKYRYRAADKNGEEDLRKSDFYINKYKEMLEEEKKGTTIYSLGKSDKSYNENIKLL